VGRAGAGHRAPQHASFHDVVDAEFARDFLGLHRLSLVRENGVAGDHKQVAKTRQFGDDVLGQAVGKKLLLRIASY
jgi:hypothetical protein